MEPTQCFVLLLKKFSGQNVFLNATYNYFQIGEGGEVPKENYLNAEEFVDLSTFTKATVGKGSSLQLDYEVKAMGSIIRY